MEFLFLVAIILSSWNRAEGASAGPTAATCETLSPDPQKHGASSQITPSPYHVDLSTLHDDRAGNFIYTPGETYLLSVSSDRGLPLRGVMLQGRVSADDTTPAGTFSVIDENTKLSACSNPDISVTHNSAVDKDSITTLWTAPPAGTGPVRIGFTVVKTLAVYWASKRSPVIFERVKLGPRQDSLLPFGVDTGDSSVPISLDGNSGLISIHNSSVSSYPFMGVEEDTIYVNTNGVLSFRSSFDDFLSTPFPLTYTNVSILIAPFWADHDIQKAGQIMYRFSEEDSLLGEVGANISNAFSTNFTPFLLFIATWDGVASVGGSCGSVNTYQVVIVTDGSSTYVLFLYRDIQWEESCSYTLASVGFNAGDEVRNYSFNLFDFAEGTPIDLPNLSNVGIPGVFYFRVDQDTVIPPENTITDIPSTEATTTAVSTTATAEATMTSSGQPDSSASALSGATVWGVSVTAVVVLVMIIMIIVAVVVVLAKKRATWKSSLNNGAPQELHVSNPTTTREHEVHVNCDAINQEKV